MKFLHYVSIINMYIFFICLLIYIQNFLISIVFNITMRNNTFLGIVYFCISLFLLKKHIHITSPYKKYM